MKRRVFWPGKCSQLVTVLFIIFFIKWRLPTNCTLFKYLLLSSSSINIDVFRLFLQSAVMLWIVLMYLILLSFLTTFTSVHLIFFDFLAGIAGSLLWQSVDYLLSVTYNAGKMILNLFYWQRLESKILVFFFILFGFGVELVFLLSGPTCSLSFFHWARSIDLTRTLVSWAAVSFFLALLPGFTICSVSVSVSLQLAIETNACHWHTFFLLYYRHTIICILFVHS